MANGISVAFPLVYGRQDGPFQLNKTIEEAVKQNFKAAGNMMWLTNGREFISGNYFLGDTTGYIIFKKEEKE